MSPIADDATVDELALRVLHGVASESEQAALGDILRSDPAARLRFVRHATQHAMLCQEGAAGALAKDRRIYFEQLAGAESAVRWPRRAWLAAAVMAAGLLVVTALLRPTDAMAALERVVAATKAGAARCYAIRVLEPGTAEEVPGRGPYPPANHLEGATIWMRGPGEFVLRQGLPNGEIRLFGGDASGSWTLRGQSAVKVSPDPTRFGRAIFTPSGEAAFLDLRTQLDQMRQDYELTWLARETGETHKLRATRKAPPPGGPKEMELWFDPVTGTVERLILRQLPRGQGGPRSIEMLLQPAEPLPADFFRHEHHHEPSRPVLLEP
jgi:hypothetical protein